jgi:uncharacterized protein YegL
MPKLNLTNDLENFKLPGSYGYSATKLGNLAASEYTLVTLVVDDSGSIDPFRADMIVALKEVIKACRYSPRADNLMIRLVTFSNTLTEFHGFKLLSNCNEDDYNNVFSAGGMTALFDATVNSVDATSAYGKTLVDSDFSTNGIVIVITDGADNQSSNGIASVAESLKKATANETLESLVSILIGVNVTDPSISKALNDLHTQGGFTQYVELNKADSRTLAKLAKFVSKSISSQSQALGTNGPSKSLTF